MAEKLNAKIVTLGGREIYGSYFGSNTEKVLEMVFNTSMVGYQEIISDLSYTDQAIVMTYPTIGNYGINDFDYESKSFSSGGLIVRNYADYPSNFRSSKTIDDVMKENDITGIYGVDTRMITKMIREEGTQRIIITSADTPKEEAINRIKQSRIPDDAVSRVSCKQRWYSKCEGNTYKNRYNIVLIDCGVKLNIVRMLNAKGCNVTIVPYNTTAEEILSIFPDGILISNGPGDPADVTEVIETINALRGKIPIFGICLGHQLVSIAHGAETYKMKFGHRGGNHPVKDLTTDKIYITSQNHSYAVDINSLENTPLKLTHINLLDNTAEGVENEEEGIFSVQFHPESIPGPQDAEHLFDRFTDLIEKWGNK